MTPRKQTQQGASKRAGRSATPSRRVRSSSSSRKGKPSASPRKKTTKAAKAKARSATPTHRWLVPFVAMALVCTFMIASYYPVLRVQYRELREKARLEAELRALRQRNERLRVDVARLQTPAGIEDLARTQLGLVKKGENVAVIVDESSPQQPSAASTPELENEVPTAASMPAGHWTAFLDRLFGVESSSAR